MIALEGTLEAVATPRRNTVTRSAIAVTSWSLWLIKITDFPSAIIERIVPNKPSATEKDWDTEYLDAIIAVKIVKDVDEAIQHVNAHGSHHTDSIVTNDAAEAEKFLAQVDSGIVLHNASTQFADGGEFGMGAEIGISTGKLHARGPVGAEQLTSYKYVVRGSGQVRP